MVKLLDPKIIKLIIQDKEVIAKECTGKAVFIDLANFPFQVVTWFKTTDEFCTFEELQNGDIK